MTELLAGASQECKLLGCQREKASTLVAELRAEIERLREENEVLQSLANGMPVSRPAAREK